MIQDLQHDSERIHFRKIQGVLEGVEERFYFSLFD